MSDCLQTHGLQHARLHYFLSFTISQSLLKLMSLESVMRSNHLILCCSLLLLLSIFPRLRVFSDELMLHIRWPKYWRFSNSPSNVNIQGWFPLGLTDLISLLSMGLSRVFSGTTIQKHHLGSLINRNWSERPDKKFRQGFIWVPALTGGSKDK